MKAFIATRWMTVSRYLTKRRFIDTVADHYFKKAPMFSGGSWAWGRRGDGDVVTRNRLYDIEARVKRNGISALQLWKHYNPFYLSYKNDKHMNYDEAKFFAEIDNISSVPPEMIDLLKTPKIHGDYMNDFILVPLCNFGTNELKNCTLFRVADISAFNKRCFTFNGAMNNETFVGQDFSTGFHFVINYRMPIYKAQFHQAEVILHPPGSAPDLNSVRFRPIGILPQQNVNIGVKATAVETTADFEKMSMAKKKCISDENYSKVTCILKKSIELSSQDCGNCLPWYILESKLFQQKDNVTCNGLLSICFENKMKQYANEIETCPQECSNTKYSTGIVSEYMYGDFEDTFEFGNLWPKYLTENPQRIPKGGGCCSSYNFAQSSNWYMRYATSLVHVNFEDHEVTVITKDAKVTFADQLGSIGGTFGIFLGLSFIGLFGMVIKALKAAKAKHQSYIDKFCKISKSCLF